MWIELATVKRFESCLISLGFPIHIINSVDIVVESHLPNVHAYADDTQLYISFKPTDGSATETDAVDALQACIRDIRTWMVQDKLQLTDRVSYHRYTRTVK